MRRRLAAGLALGALLLFLTRSVWLTGLGSFLVNAQEPTQADIALVLAGDSRGNRILKAAELVRHGYVPHVLVSGPDGMYGSHECELEIAFAVRAGYPESYFLHFENTARSTEEEAAQSAVELRRRGVRRLLLVTSDFHTRRAGKLFRAAMPDLEVVVVAAPDVNFSPGGWWTNREGRKTALYEWMKTVASWVHL
jgi:uncharacterized SAM-binding protein YcdF (DUF218 family)